MRNRTMRAKNSRSKMRKSMKTLNGMRNGIIKINLWKYFFILLSIDLKKQNM